MLLLTLLSSSSNTISRCIKIYQHLIVKKHHYSTVILQLFKLFVVQNTYTKYSTYLHCIDTHTADRHTHSMTCDKWQMNEENAFLNGMFWILIWYQFHVNTLNFHPFLPYLLQCKTWILNKSLMCLSSFMNNHRINEWPLWMERCITVQTSPKRRAAVCELDAQVNSYDCHMGSLAP